MKYYKDIDSLLVSFLFSEYCLLHIYTITFGLLVYAWKYYDFDIGEQKGDGQAWIC